jgi:UDP-glucose:(heptosyl)LPS alpha-1,3-glucosyltransferase
MGHKIFVVARECDDDIHPDLIHVPVKVSNRTSAARNLSFHHNSQQALKNLSLDRVYALSRTFPADVFRVSDPLHDCWLDIRYPGSFRNRLERLNPRHRAILALERGICAARHTGAIITNSALAKQQLLARYNYPAERIHVVYNGVDLDRFRPGVEDSFRTGPLRLLFVAQDFVRKGLGYILQALQQLAVEGIACHLTVVGRDDPRPFRKQAERLGVEQSVAFCEPSYRIEEFYNAADLFVFPTLSDPFANVCLEALACGLPVMTTINNGAAEILEEAQTGYVLQSANPLVSQMVEGIVGFSRLSREHRLEMGRGARQCAERFTIENNARRTLEVLMGVPRPGGC